MALGCCWKIESLLVRASEFVHHGSDNPFLSTSRRNICYFDEKLIEWGKYIYINENTNGSHQPESFDVSLGTKWLQLYQDAGCNPEGVTRGVIFSSPWGHRDVLTHIGRGNRNLWERFKVHLSQSVSFWTKHELYIVHHTLFTALVACIGVCAKGPIYAIADVLSDVS